MIQCAKMTAVDVVGHPASLVLDRGVIWTALIGFCGTLPSVPAYLDRQSRKSNHEGHEERFCLVSRISVDLSVLLGRTGRPRRGMQGRRLGPDGASAGARPMQWRNRCECQV